MIRAKRLEVIRELAGESEIVSWDALQERLGVSKATARRDIDLLCREGVAEKTRGGIIFLKDNNHREPSVFMRELKYPEAKRKIAAQALTYISGDDFVMLDSGSTVMELARLIKPSMRLGVVTYSIAVAELLTKIPSVDLFLVGGMVRKNFHTCHGFLAENMLREFHVRTFFMGADAVNMSSGVMGYNMNDVRLKQIMIANSEQVVLMCDHSKFTSTAFLHIANLNQVDVVVTDEETDDKYIRALQERDIRVVQAR